jgi:predicted ABC-type transport system involved in lysophospholipase L1 biosynthesis ATPase subunit
MSSSAIDPDGFVLRAHDVHKDYALPRQTIQVLRGVSLAVSRGETLCIRGASGAGKSTLLHILGGLERPSRGGVHCLGSDVYHLPESARSSLRAQRVGFVFQSYHLLPELDTLENVMLPGLKTAPAWGRRSALRERASVLLERVGLSDRLHHRPMELSGGEQQRVALARSMINRPEILFADEPTGNLDSHTGGHVLELMFRMVCDLRHTLVLVTHNDALAGRCSRTLVLRDGVIMNHE